MKKKIVNYYLTEALFSLLKNKDLCEITITELIEKAGVGRSSFYRNYYTLTDIISEYLEKMTVLSSPTPEMNSDNIEEIVQAVFEKLLTEKQKLKILEKRNVLYLLDEIIYQKSLSQIVFLNVLNNDYQPYFFAGASAFMI